MEKAISEILVFLEDDLQSLRGSARIWESGSRFNVPPTVRELRQLLNLQHTIKSTTTHDNRFSFIRNNSENGELVLFDEEVDVPTSDVLFPSSDGTMNAVRIRLVRVVAIAVDTLRGSRFAFNWTLTNLVREGDEIVLLHLSQGSSDVELLDILERRCRSVGVRYTTATFKTSVTQANKNVIMDKVLELKADVLVVGTRGLGPVARKVLGSVSDSAVRTAKCSVVVVRPKRDDLTPQQNGDDSDGSDTESGPTGEEPVRNVVLGLDSSEEAEMALKWAVRTFMKKEGVTFHLLSVLKGRNDSFTMHSAERCRLNSIHSETVLRAGSDAEESIKAFCREVCADFLILGGKKPGFLKKTGVKESTSCHLTHNAGCPVAVIKHITGKEDWEVAEVSEVRRNSLSF
eukprot:Rmarinus@m.2348